MKQPKDKEEMKLLMTSLLDSYNQEIEEINDFAPNVEDIFYSEHRGCWILTYKNGLNDDEFDTKEELMEFLKTEGND